MFALIGNLDSMEVVIVLIAAILIFGHRLPQVAAQAGAQLGKLRRTLDSAWKDSGADHEVREMQRSIESIRDAVPRDLSAGSVARLAANEFQRRVERNQGTEEALAATPVTPANAGESAASSAVAPVAAPIERARPAPDDTVARGALENTADAERALPPEATETSAPPLHAPASEPVRPSSTDAAPN